MHYLLSLSKSPSHYKSPCKFELWKILNFHHRQSWMAGGMLAHELSETRVSIHARCWKSAPEAPTRAQTGDMVSKLCLLSKSVLSTSVSRKNRGQWFLRSFEGKPFVKEWRKNKSYLKGRCSHRCSGSTRSSMCKYLIILFAFKKPHRYPWIGAIVVSRWKS